MIENFNTDPFAAIASANLTDQQMSLMTDAMMASVERFPDDCESRMIFARGAFRVISEVPAPPIVQQSMSTVFN